MRVLIFVFIGIGLMVGIGAYVLVYNHNQNTENINPDLKDAIISRAGTPIDSMGLAEEWYITCIDNAIIIFNESKIVTLPNPTNTGIITIIGAYQPSKHNYELYPQCTNVRDMNNYMNMTCMTQNCKEIVNYNVLNGTKIIIWKKGDIW